MPQALEALTSFVKENEATWHATMKSDADGSEYKSVGRALGRAAARSRL